MNYIIHSTVVSVTSEERVARGHMVNGEPVFDREKLGWFLLLLGSHEKLFLGWEKPELKTGDKVRITIAKEPVAQP